MLSHVGQLVPQDSVAIVREDLCICDRCVENSHQNQKYILLRTRIIALYPLVVSVLSICGDNRVGVHALGF